MADDRSALQQASCRSTEGETAFQGASERERSDLTVEHILAWADAYHAEHGTWPVVGPLVPAEPVAGAPGESWKAINHALALGLRGLPGDSSLGELLAEHRGAPLPDMGALALARKIWAWEQEQFPIKGPRKRRGPSVKQHCPRLTIDAILGWADAHRATTGQWPKANSGRVLDAPCGVTWKAVHCALCKGHRGLPGGQTLRSVLAEHRGDRHPFLLTRLTVEQILAWADAHFATHAVWPTSGTGPIDAVPGKTWCSIDSALARGRRGLPGGTSLARLLDDHGRRKAYSRTQNLTQEQILAWADAHHDATGHWPKLDSGGVLGAPDETWRGIHEALRRGYRGLPKDSSLPRFLGAHRGVRNHRALPRLTRDRILVWAEAHQAEHGRWPCQRSGPVAAAPGETWRRIDKALRYGRRGLPGGSSLHRLRDAHLRRNGSPDSGDDPGLGHGS